MPAYVWLSARYLWFKNYGDNLRLWIPSHAERIYFYFWQAVSKGQTTLFEQRTELTESWLLYF